MFIFFFKQKTAYELRISDWSSDVCSSDLFFHRLGIQPGERAQSLQFIENCIQAMAETATEIDRFFFDWRYGDVQRPDQYAGEHWHKARAEVSAFIPAGQRDHPYWASNEDGRASCRGRGGHEV